MLDTVVSIETPEGIDFDLVPSGPLARILAYASDFLIRALVLFVIGIVLGSLGEFGAGIMLLCFFVLEWLYPVFFEVKKGATPGKKWMNLRVVHDDGTPVSVSSSLLRNLLRAADILPLFYLAGLVSMLCNKEFKRLGDLAAGTLVIQLPDPPEEVLHADVAPVPAPFHLTPEEQKAIIQFTQRSKVLSEARQLELAQALQPVLLCPDAELVRRIHQIGSYLLGVKGNAQNEISGVDDPDSLTSLDQDLADLSKQVAGKQESGLPPENGPIPAVSEDHTDSDKENQP